MPPAIPPELPDTNDSETSQLPSNIVPEHLPLGTGENQRSIYRILEPDEIRLIELWPGEPCNEYKLIYTTLSACRSGRGYRYTALSYVWGDINNTTTAIVDGKPLSITASLNSALENIRQTLNNVVYLWADAISINQQNIEERTHQVRQMASIYSCAEKTIIYLFDDAPLSYGLWKLRKNVLTRVKPSVRPILSHPWFTRIWVLQELITSPNPQVQCGHKCESWDSICTILDLKVSDTNDGSHGKRDRIVRDYFQDANLDSDLDIQKWLVVPSWDSVPHSRTISKYLEALEHHTGVTNAQETLESRLANINADEEHKDAFRGLRLLSEMEDLRSTCPNTTSGNQEKDYYLLKVLQFRRGLGVSDPRDMLFAHTKMVSVPHLDQMVDYASSCKTVYEGFARYLIDEVAGLRLLSFVEDIELEKRHTNLIIPGQSNSTETAVHETIVSWAPNWKIMTPDHQGQYLRNVVLKRLNPDPRGQPSQMWSHNLSSNRIWLHDGSVLGCIGVLIDFTHDNTEPAQQNSKHHAHITNDEISSRIKKRDLLLPESYRGHDVLCFIADAPESIHVLRPCSTPEGLPIDHAHQCFERKQSEYSDSGSHTCLSEKPIPVDGLEIRHYKYIGHCFVEGLENSDIHKEMERGRKVIIAIH